MKTLPVSAFKTHCIAELKALQRNGGAIEVTVRGRPIARVLPVPVRRRRLGALAGLVRGGGLAAPASLDKDFDGQEAARLRGNRR